VIFALLTTVNIKVIVTRCDTCYFCERYHYFWKNLLWPSSGCKHLLLWSWR